MFFLLAAVGSANATLITIGTAQFGGTGTAYNLIWDDDNNGNSLVWLDYTHGAANWSAQMAWAAELDATLTYDIDPGFTVDFGANSWRLPSTVDGPYEHSNAGTTSIGFNITSSEMGHLYYTELGNLGLYSTNGTIQAGSGLVKTGDFNNLIISVYWSGTVASVPSQPSAWYFATDGGVQSYINMSPNPPFAGLAVRTVGVTYISDNPVPEPATMLLFGLGLLGAAGVIRRK